MPKSAYKRTQYIVDRQYQYRFVTRLFMVVLGIAVVSACLSSLLLWRDMYSTGGDSSPLLIVGLVAVAMTLLIELLIAIPLLFVVGIRQSHRIIGPMNRIKRTLEAIGKGDFSRRITLRQGDALEDLATSINQVAEDLGRRFPKSSGS